MGQVDLVMGSINLMMSLFDPVLLDFFIEGSAVNA